MRKIEVASVAAVPKPRRVSSLPGTMAETSKMGYDATYSTASYSGIHGGKEANCRTRGVRPGSKDMVDGIERPVRAQRLCIEPGRVPHDIAWHGPGPDRVERTIMGPARHRHLDPCPRPR